MYKILLYENETFSSPPLPQIQKNTNFVINESKLCPSSDTFPQHCTHDAHRRNDRVALVRSTGEQNEEKTEMQRGSAEAQADWRFQSLCRNVIAAFFIEPRASRGAVPSSAVRSHRQRIRAHFITRSLQALHLQRPLVFFPFCGARDAATLQTSSILRVSFRWRFSLLPLPLVQHVKFRKFPFFFWMHAMRRDRPI